MYEWMFKMTAIEQKLKNVLSSPDLKVNLFPLSKAMENDVKFVF